MQIEYFEKLERLSHLGIIEIEGFSEKVINRIEIFQGIQFPKAYREFLFLCGKQDHFPDWESGKTAEEAIEIQQDTFKKLSDANFSLPHLFWNFADQDRGEVFLFFYLHEGDNPPVYICDKLAYFPEDGDFNEYVRQTHETFSDFIDEAIELKLSKSKS